MLVLQFEEYIKDPAKIIQEQILPFLGVNRLSGYEMNTVNTLPVNNPTIYDFEMSSSTRIMMDDFFEPYNRMLAGLLKDEKFTWP